MRKFGLMLILFMVFVFWGNTVYAVPIIDFADKKFAAVHGKTMQTVSNVYGDLDITFYSFPTDKKLTHNPGPGGGVDGIGIGDDEVSKGEILYFEFSEKLNISKLYITDLFYEGKPAYREQGQYQLFIGNSLLEGSWSELQSFQAPMFRTGNGEFEIDIDPLLSVNAIQFMAPLYSRNDFSVRGLDPSPVPEPATMLMLGFGLLGLAGYKKKIRKQQ